MTASSQIPDAAFQKKIVDIRKALSESLNEGKPELIRAAVTARTSLQAALSEFDRLRQEVVGRVEPLRSLILRHWKLTPALTYGVKEMSGRTQQAIKQLEDNAISDARIGLKEIDVTLFPELLN